MDLKMVINTDILFAIKIKLSVFKKYFCLAIVLFLSNAQASNANISYLPVSQYATDAYYKKIIAAATNTLNNFKLFRIKNLTITDPKLIEQGEVAIPATDKIELEEDTSFTTSIQLDCGKKNNYISNNKRLFEYASYNNEHSNNLNQLANITLYLGLTAYRNLANNYYLATFSYYSNYNSTNNKIEPAFAINAASPTAIITATNTTMKGLVVLGNLDSTKCINSNNEITATTNLKSTSSLQTHIVQLSQNSALIFKGGIVAKQLQITDGITIAKCAKLIADATSGAALSITDNTRVKAHIYNYGEITAAFAVKVGNTAAHPFPLISADKHVKFYNYTTGFIQSTEKKQHIALQANGAKDQDIESFSVINYGKIIGGLEFNSKKNNMLTFEVINHQQAIIGDQHSTIKKDNAVVNITNSGTIILNGSSSNSAMQVNNYIAEATSQLILIFKNINYNNNNSLIYCNGNAEFKKDSLLIIKGTNQNHTKTNNKVIKLITADGTITFTSNDEKTHLAVQSYNIASEKYIIKPTNTTYESSKTLKFEVAEEKVSNLFPTEPIILKDISRIIDIVNGIENLIFKENKYLATINLKYLVNKITQTNLNLYDLALKKCFDIEDFINNIMPDTSGAAIISNNRITEIFNHHIRQRIAVRLQPKIDLANLYKDNKLNYGNINNNIAMWSGYSRHISKEEASTEYNRNEISSVIYSIGLDAYCYNDITVGVVFGYSKTTLTKYGIKIFKNSNPKNNKSSIEKENLITKSLAVYTAYGFEQLDIDLSIMYSQSKHKPKASKLNDNSKNRIYNARIFNLTSSSIYPLQTGILSLGINTQIKYTNIYIPKRINRNNNTDGEKYGNIFTFGIGLLAKSTKKISHKDIHYDVLIGYYYKYILGNNKISSGIDNIDIVHVPQRMPEKHNLFTAAKIILNLTRKMDLEFDFNFLIEKTNNDYSYALYARYHL